MPKVLINYRREDTAGHAGRLYDLLAQRLGPDNVFMDIDTIAPGADFLEAIREAVTRADVVIALIGRQWLSVGGRSGQRRLDEPEDFVRVEIETALERGIRVIPVLVQGASMPASSDLPAPLAPLARRNAFRLDDIGFRRDLSALIEVLISAMHSRNTRGFSTSWQKSRAQSCWKNSTSTVSLWRKESPSNRLRFKSPV